MDDWERRVAAVWADEEMGDLDRVERIDALAAERGSADARAAFERAGARDSAGLEADAEALYRHALALGLDDEHRPQAVIQLASTIRNLGKTEESLRLLRGELDREPVSPLRDEASAFYALALLSDGQERLAASIALDTLAPHLSRYTRSVRAYAAEAAEGRR